VTYTPTRAPKCAARATYGCCPDGAHEAVASGYTSRPQTHTWASCCCHGGKRADLKRLNDLHTQNALKMHFVAHVTALRCYPDPVLTRPSDRDCKRDHKTPGRVLLAEAVRIMSDSWRTYAKAARSECTLWPCHGSRMLPGTPVLWAIASDCHKHDHKHTYRAAGGAVRTRSKCTLWPRVTALDAARDLVRRPSRRICKTFHKRTWTSCCCWRAGRILSDIAGLRTQTSQVLWPMSRLSGAETQYSRGRRIDRAIQHDKHTWASCAAGGKLCRI
jgi:hypothetical protein